MVANLRRVAVASAAVALAAVLLVGGLDAPAGEKSRPAGPRPVPTVSPAPTAATTTTTTPGLPDPPPLGWSACGAGRQCSTLVVPRDYADAGGPTIGVALERRPASDPAHRIGSLVLNPGGPGESGVLNLDKDLAVLPPEVLDRFDVVAFDPRGVGRSEAIHCAADTYQGATPDPVPQTPAAAQTLLAADRAYADACGRGAGSLLAHVGTLDVARDVEELRRALGDDRLTYLGLSYGTLLGLTYAQMFPDRVRAMALDGVLDPALSTADLAENQAVGFERALDSFLAWCTAAGSGCAWHPQGEPHTAFRALADTVRAHPLAVGAQQVGPQEFYTGAFGTLYSRGFWPSLGRALAGVAAGNGAPMLGLFTGYERVGDPSFDGDANNAVTCLDHPVPSDPAAYPALAAAAATAAPDFGPLFAWNTLSCAVWPVPASAERVPAPVRAAGSPPILLIATTADPATPLAWAQDVASHLADGVVLTRTGVDHVALFYSSCVRDWDAAYLVSLRTPPPGTVCP